MILWKMPFRVKTVTPYTGKGNFFPLGMKKMPPGVPESLKRNVG